MTLLGIKGISGYKKPRAAPVKPSPLEIARNMIAMMREDDEVESAVPENINPEIPIIPKSPLANYVETLNGWKPRGRSDLPPTPPSAFPDASHAPAWASWWAAIDRRNRVYRQGIHVE